MLPALRQKLMIVLAVVVGGGCFAWVKPVVAAGDASSGIALVSSGSGLVWSVIVLMLAAVPAVFLGAVVASRWGVWTGVFTVSAGLSVLAWRGGAIDGFLRRAEMPGGYGWLGFEMVLWTAGVVAVVVGLVGVMVLFAKRQSGADTGVGANDGANGGADGGMNGDMNGGGWATSRERLGRELMGAGWKTPKAYAGGAFAVAAGGALSWFLMRSTDTAQIYFSLIVAFTVAGLFGRMIFPRSSVALIALSPCVVGLIGYVWVWLAYDNAEGVYQAWFNLGLMLPNAGRLPGIALGLPIFYASAGVMGATLGIAWARGLAASSAGKK